MATRPYFRRRADRGTPEAACRACGRPIPEGSGYCIWCGVNLAEADHYRDERETGLRLEWDLPGEEELRPLLRHRRKQASCDGARALLAFEALLGDHDGVLDLQCLEELSLAPLDYQVRTAQRVLGPMHGRAILADEVGLGKTIEAGLVVRELLSRKVIENVLILVPSSLLEQWKGEMAEKFAIEVDTHESERPWRRPRLLLSLTRAKQERVARRLAKRRWDLVIVDEAHSLKNARTVAHNFVKGLRTDRLLLLTATPIENDLRELYNLLTLVDPAVYPTFRKFARDFLVSRYRVRDAARLRRFCEGYMVRNRRTIAFPDLPPRLPTLVRCVPTEREAEFFRRTLAFVRQVYGGTFLTRKSRTTGEPEGSRSATMLFLTLLLKESCSSPDAVLATVGQVVLPRLGEGPAGRLRELLALGTEVGQTGKMAAFLEEVGRVHPEPAVAYVEFFATHARLSELLRQRGIPVVPFTGRMNGPEKQAQLERFRRDGGLLLCTEVGGQGLNLQHCSTVINYDVPWNPMRLEQRIGRVHRYGQERPIRVINFVADGTYEEHVFQLLAQKLELFTQAIGEVEAILSFVEEEESLQQMVARAICEARDDGELEENFDRLNAHFAESVRRFRRSQDATSQWLDGGEEA